MGGSSQTIRLTVTALAAVVAVMTTMACGPTSNQRGGMSQRGSSAPAPDQADISEALTFGGIVLPPSAKVLGVQHDQGIDQRYRLVISLDPGDVDAILTGSGFTTALQPDPGPYPESVDGFTLDGATNVTSAEDNLPASGQRKRNVFRQVAIDDSDPAKPIAHWWVFTT
jgi:hypothetical protein